MPFAERARKPFLFSIGIFSQLLPESKERCGRPSCESDHLGSFKSGMSPAGAEAAVSLKSRFAYAGAGEAVATSSLARSFALDRATAPLCTIGLAARTVTDCDPITVSEDRGLRAS